MRRITTRLLRLTLAVGAFLAVVLNSQPTTSSISEARPAPPTRDEIQVLDELHGWVEGFEAEGSDGDLATAIRERRDSFELFSSYHRGPAQRRMLRNLPYGDQIVRAAKRHEIDSFLVAAVVEAESSFNPYAISVDGALGLMQVLPASAPKVADDLLRPKTNLNAGSRYLAWLLGRFGSDVELALAAYNAGPGAVDRHGGVPPYRETRHYVARVLDRYVGLHQTLWREHMRREWYAEPPEKKS